jgi:hypothetical protein
VRASSSSRASASERARSARDRESAGYNGEFGYVGRNRGNQRTGQSQPFPVPRLESFSTSDGGIGSFALYRCSDKKTCQRNQERKENSEDALSNQPDSTSPLLSIASAVELAASAKARSVERRRGERSETVVVKKEGRVGERHSLRTSERLSSEAPRRSRSRLATAGERKVVKRRREEKVAREENMAEGVDGLFALWR